MAQKTILDIRAMKGTDPISMLTAYDFQTASMLDEAGVDILLIGDSLANVIYGEPNTLGVSLETMLRHTQAVSRAAKRALVVADMPFGSYQPSVVTAVESASRFLGEGGAHAVKLEGGLPMEATVRRLVEIGIPVMGHVGLTPQSLHQLGGYRIQGKENAHADRIVEDALSLERAGAFAIVIECVPAALAQRITEAVKVPTIGIGSGPACDGQVLVINDLLGQSVMHIPKFVKPMTDLRAVITETAKTYVTKVKERKT